MGRLCTMCKDRQAIFDEAICDFCLEAACVKNQENFGRPERVHCSECGGWGSPEDFIEHLPCEGDDD